MFQRYFDISVPISPAMLTWATHEAVSFLPVEGGDDGEVRYQVTKLRMSTHTGSHVDAPYHAGISDQTVDQLPLEALIGPAYVYDFRGATAITADLLKETGGLTPRVLLKTDNSQWVRTGPMPAMWTHLTGDGAAYLVQQGVRLVGTDGLTVDSPTSSRAHQILFRAGVIIVETLDLTAVEPGAYELLCLPLRLQGGDGAPARVVLRQG